MRETDYNTEYNELPAASKYSDSCDQSCSALSAFSGRRRRGPVRHYCRMGPQLEQDQMLHALGPLGNSTMFL